MSDLAAPPGLRLKTERELRGLSAQKAADELHLDAWVITALEADEYQRIGPSVYAKGHLKKYAALLGLPVAEILAGYESKVLAPDAPPVAAVGGRLGSMGDAAPVISNLPRAQIAGFAAVLAVLVGVMWWKPWRHRGSPTQEAPVAAAPALAAPEPPSAGDAAGIDADAAPAPVAAPTVTSTPGAAVTAAGSATTSVKSSANPAPPTGASDASAGAGKARLRLSFSANSWVDVHDANGRRAYAGNGLANSVKTIAGVAPMRVYLGYASGVQLEINDRAVAISPQFFAGDVARFEAGADGVLRRDSHTTAAPSSTTRNTRPPG